MAHVDIERDFEFDSPTLVEGLPGAGLVGKIAADHLVDQFDMDRYGGVHCGGLPRAVVYHAEDSGLMSPVRIYGDAERDLLVLQSDVPVSPSSAEDFAGCITRWVDEEGVLPLYLSGLPEEKNGVPDLYGVATGDAEERLDEAGIVPPKEDGIVSGPTGALLYEAERSDLDSVGLVAETEAKFPDPEAARVVLEHGVAPLADVEIDTGDLVERAEEIRNAKERLAEQIEGGGDESSEAKPLRMFQ